MRKSWQRKGIGMFTHHILHLVKDFGTFKSEIHPVLLIDNDERILFDAGYPGQAEDIARELARHGLKVKDLTMIVVSHHDHDHIGSLLALKIMHPAVRIVAGRSEADYIAGKKISLRLQQAEEHNKTLGGSELEFAERFAAYLKTIDICPVDRLVDDGEHLSEGVRVISTPGHTPGHISLYVEKQGIFIAGDATAVENGRLILPNPQFTLDMSRALDSIRRIQSLKINSIINYHGGIYSGDIVNALGRVLAANSSLQA